MKKPRNKFEQRIYKELTKAKANFRYESERIPYVVAGHYIPDFIIQTPSGRIIIECKGYFRPEAKRKMLVVKRQHPEIDLRILFYAPRKEQIKWAEKNGFRYAIGSIPKEWLAGL